MTALTVPLTASASVTLDGNGNGQVTLGPTLPGTSWQPVSVAVLVQPVSLTVVSQFLLYNGSVQPANFIGGSYTGDTNSAGLGLTLQLGQIISGVWAGGNPGALATMTLTGTMTIPGGP